MKPTTTEAEAARLLTEMSKIVSKEVQGDVGKDRKSPCPMSPSVESQSGTIISDITEDSWETTSKSTGSLSKVWAVSISSQDTPSKSLMEPCSPLIFPGVLQVKIPYQVHLKPPAALLTPISLSSDSCRHWNWSGNTKETPSLPSLGSSFTGTQAKAKVVTKRPPPKRVRATIRKKFSWKRFPELEAFLVANREDYLKHSTLNYTSEQKSFNNQLTERLLALADIHGYVFENFSFVMVRDRIRCYYKSYVQALKKKGIIVGYSARKAGLV